MVDAGCAADTGLIAETQYAHIIALRYNEPGASLGSEQTQ